MSAYRLNAIALIVSTSMLSCFFYKRNENYCEDRNRNDNCSEPPWDAAVDAPRPCQTSADCTAPAGVCDLSAGTANGKCVMCTATDDAACSGAGLVCGVDNMCHACSAHSQCASQVCLPEGKCNPVNATNVAYVAPPPTGSGTNCTRTAPCALVSTALKTGRGYIKISGTITDNPIVEAAQTVTILADPLAILTPKLIGPMLELKGGSDLEIYDLELSGAQGTAGHAISIPASSPSTLTLHRVKILNNDGAGIKVDGGTLTISRSYIAENKGGGVVMDSATTFNIVNNFIVQNGSPLSDVGGVQAKPAGNSKLEFNTIVDNKAKTNALAGGVICNDVFAVPNNLIFRNSGGGITVEQVHLCNPAGSPTVDVGANFRSSTDYHLTPSTAPSILDEVECNGNLEDYDGERRPQGAGCDLGADEYKAVAP